MLTDEATKAISWIVVNIANPALILSASVSGTATMKGAELLKGFGIAILVFVFFDCYFCFSAFFVLRVSAEDKGVFRVMTIFSNIGFMGFPVISAVYGADALLYASLFLFPYNILIYTYGIMAMGKKKEER